MRIRQFPLFLLFAAASLALLLLPAASARAQADPAGAGQLRPLVDALDAKNLGALSKAVDALAATGDAAVVPALRALMDGDLYIRKSDKAVVIGRSAGGGYALSDPLTGAALGNAPRNAVDKVRVNNALRRTVRAAVGGLDLMSPDRARRMAAAQAVFAEKDADFLPALDAALATEKDKGVRLAMERARAATILASDAAPGEKIAAIETVAARGDRDALASLNIIAAETEDDTVRAAARKAAAGIETNLQVWNAAQNVWYGLSLGSVLLLAAVGLAITFGVMGVINMAHGEMVMLGAYTTFVVQSAMRSAVPDLIDVSLLLAVPAAFLVAGAVGVAIERGVIRYLYGRPLETLLATWGISLILQQAVRTIFGPTNQEVGNPSWMSGAFEVGLLTITYNRLWILVFALVVLAALMLVLRRTPIGLQMRAVTQNRPMASNMGIRTDRVDALTFGLGSGIAGIAGVALSQIDNVSPNLGQSYIIDSFMVVVFGGVGNLWGTLVGAMTLGVANKFLEPYAGAVLGKILVLVFIILFIQRRPRGLFALKGRAVDA